MAGRAGEAGWLVLGAMLFAVACAGPSSFSAPVPEAQRLAYEAALRRSATDAKAGASELEAFVALYPASPMADDAALRIAELALAAGRPDDGQRWLGTILTQYPTSDAEPSARLRLAEIEYARDRRVAARGMLEPVDWRRLPGESAARLLELRVALAQTPVERMDQLARLRAMLEDSSGPSRAGALGPVERTKRLREADREIDGLVSRAALPELEAMLVSLRQRPPADAVAFELAERAVERGDRRAAIDALDRARRLARGSEWRAKLATLERSLEARPANAAPVGVDGAPPAAGELDLAPLRDLSQYTRPITRGARGTLGVVLPLSGDFAEFGQASLQGILLAAGVFEPGDAKEAELASGGLRFVDDEASGNELRVVVRDTGGDPARAAAAVSELAQREDVVAIVGPIFSDEVLAAAGAAESAGVPLVTLSNREDVTQGRRFVMRTRTTPSDEVGVLVDHAMRTHSATRFGVLYPRTRYGRGMRKLYADAVVARGGRLVALGSYSPEETDFTDVIKTMLGYRFLAAEERQAIAARDRAIEAARSLPPAQAARARSEAMAAIGPGGDPLPPIVDFDVLFIPDSADSVAMIAPGLALQGVRDVRLLGTSEWIDEALLRGADRHVAGAVVSAPFFANSDVAIVREFVDAYRATFDATPDELAAQGFDAANLVLQQITGSRRDRESIRSGILETRAYPGASGSLTMSPDGNARRRPFLLGVSGQRFVPLD